MVKRKVELVTGEVYHVFTKSIAGYKVFNNDSEYYRMRDALKFYQVNDPPLKFKYYVLKDKQDKIFSLVGCGKLVNVIAYCIMPTHLHLVLKQLTDEGITVFMGNILNGYARYFNTKHKRKGPLWESRFKNILVENDEQLLHLTRYLHLNPTTAFLVERPEEWTFSSYGEYISDIHDEDRVCNTEGILDIARSDYKSFVEDNVDYQRSLSSIKRLSLED